MTVAHCDKTAPDSAGHFVSTCGRLQGHPVIASVALLWSAGTVGRTFAVAIGRNLETSHFGPAESSITPLPRPEPIPSGHNASLSPVTQRGGIVLLISPRANSGIPQGRLGHMVGGSNPLSHKGFEPSSHQSPLNWGIPEPRNPYTTRGFRLTFSGASNLLAAGRGHRSSDTCDN